MLLLIQRWRTMLRYVSGQRADCTAPIQSTHLLIYWSDQGSRIRSISLTDVHESFRVS